MNRTVRVFLVLAFLLVLSRPGFSQTLASLDTGRSLLITVQIYNRADVPQDDLILAQTQVSAILKQAGVRAAWLNCTVDAATRQPTHVCGAPIRSTNFVINIVDSFKPEWKWLPDDALGFSPMPAEGEFAVYAYVSFERTLLLAKRGYASSEMILGLAMAHELGHLLLGLGGHSGRGLMRAHWAAKDLLSASGPDLLFTSQQVERIRTALLRRLQQEEEIHVAAEIARERPR